MAKKEPLYPHRPKSKGPLYPYNKGYKTPQPPKESEEPEKDLHTELLKYITDLRGERNITAKDIFVKAQTMGANYGGIIESYSVKEGWGYVPKYVVLLSDVLKGSEFVQWVERGGYEVLQEYEAWYIKYHLTGKSFIAPFQKTQELAGETAESIKLEVTAGGTLETKKEIWWRLAVFSDEIVADNFKDWLDRSGYNSEPVTNAGAVIFAGITYE